MLTKLENAVALAEKLGAHFTEARFDNLTYRTLVRINDTWKEINLRSRTGVGIVCYYDGTAGYSFSAGNDKEDIEKAVKRAYKMAKASSPSASLKLDFDPLPPVKSHASDSYSVKIHPNSKGLDYKTDLVNRSVEAAKETGKNIQSVTGRYAELFGKKFFTNSDGSQIIWEFIAIDLPCRVTAKTSLGNLVYGAESISGTAGLEIFNSKGKTPEDIGHKAGSYATEQLKAKSCPAGKFRALIENFLTGVLAHESFGHLSEGDFVVRGTSPLADKMGERLGTDHATIVDGGTPNIQKFGGLWIPFDDQGIKATETVVLDQGILSSFLQSRGTAKKLGQKPTGNCRAVHFGFMPIPRMTNTYFMPGTLTEDEALEQLKKGIYAIQTIGGQVDSDGSFLFKAIRGYWIEHGKIQHPIREVSLSGNILDLLNRVQGATKDLEITGGLFGGCGKSGQHPLPVGLGGPKLIVDNVTFGGTA